MRYYRGPRPRNQPKVLRLVLAFVDIALHRRGPDMLPASRFLLWLVVIVYLAVSYAAFALTPPPAADGVDPAASAAAQRALDYAPVLIPIDCAIYAAFIWVLLKSFNRDRRFLQTATALFGTDTLFTSMSLPVLAWAGALGATESPGPTLAYWVLFIWSIDVSAFVLSRAIERPYALAVLVVVGYVLLSVSLRASLLNTGS